MDKIIKMSETANERFPDQPKSLGPPIAIHNETEIKDKSIFDKAKEKLGVGAAPVTATSRPPADCHSRFSIDDCVVIQTARGVPVKGWVRWVGPVKMSKSAGGITVSTVGIETVS